MKGAFGNEGALLFYEEAVLKTIALARTTDFKQQKA